VPPEMLPCQVSIEKGGKLSYHNKLNAYLRKHFNRMYSEIYDFQFSAVMPRDPGLHFMIGPTVRTATNGGRYHVVVGLNGEFLWDPHPSRAGLTYVERWGLLGPIPERLEQDWAERIPKMDPEIADSMYSCVCPSCRKDA
jgi:hypothetical protein